MCHLCWHCRPRVWLALGVGIYRLVTNHLLQHCHCSQWQCFTVIGTENWLCMSWPLVFYGELSGGGDKSASLQCGGGAMLVVILTNPAGWDGSGVTLNKTNHFLLRNRNLTTSSVAALSHLTLTWYLMMNQHSKKLSSYCVHEFLKSRNFA